MRNIFFVLVIAIGFLTSCQKVDTSGVQLPKQQITNEKVEQIRTETKQRLELITLLTMDVFANRNDLFEKLKASIKSDNLRKGFEGIYFKDIIKNDNSISNGFSSEFLRECRNRFESENFKLSNQVKPTIAKLKAEIATKLSATRSTNNFEITDETLFMPYLGSYIYTPFSEDFPNATSANAYYCYDPQDEAATTVTVYKNTNGNITSQIVTGSDDWAEQNATVVIRLDDEIAGNHLDNYLTSPCANGVFYRHLCTDEVLGVDSVPPPPPPTPSYCGPLQNNIAPFAYNTIDDRYLISATMPKIRLLGNLRWAFWSGGNDIAFYRGNARIAQPDREVFSEAIIDSSFQVFAKTITRKDGRKKNWVDCNALYSNNWKLEQKDNYVALTVVKNWLHFDGADIDFNATAGVFWDTTRVPKTVTVNGVTATILAARGWVPNFNASANVAGTINIRRREALEGEQHIPRVSVISNAIGNNFGLQGSCNLGLDCEKN